MQPHGNVGPLHDDGLRRCAPSACGGGSSKALLAGAALAHQHQLMRRGDVLKHGEGRSTLRPQNSRDNLMQTLDLDSGRRTGPAGSKGVVAPQR